MDGLRLDASSYDKATFAEDVRPFIEKLKRNKCGIAVLTMHGGTKYEMSVPGMNRGQPLPLGEWKAIVENMVRIMAHEDMRILHADQPAANTHLLDQTVINKTGVTFEGAVKNHTAGTKPIYKTLKGHIKKHADVKNAETNMKTSSASKKAVKKEPGSDAAERSHAPGASRSTGVNPLPDLPDIDGMEEGQVQALQADIDRRCGIERGKEQQNGQPVYLDEGGRVAHWAELANALTDKSPRTGKSMSEETLESFEIAPGAAHQAKTEVEKRYREHALNVFQEGIELAIDGEILKIEGWRSQEPEELKSIVTRNVRGLISPHIAPRSGTIKDPRLIEAIKERQKAENLTPCVAARLNFLQTQQDGRGIGQRMVARIPTRVRNLANVPGASTLTGVAKGTWGWLNSQLNMGID